MSVGVHFVSRRFRTAFVLVLAASLVAFLWQGFATATHIHPVQDSAAAARARAAPAQLTIPAVPRGQPIDCPLCHDAAIAGHFLSSGAVLVVVPFAVVAWRSGLVFALSVHETKASHAWRSRAPPPAATA